MKRTQYYLFVPYEQALDLKNLGFDEYCSFHWSIGLDDFKQIINSEQYSRGNAIQAPLYQQALKFCRDKGALYCINPSSEYGKYHVGLLLKDGWKLIEDADGKAIKVTYEEAETIALDKLIRLLKINK